MTDTGKYRLSILDVSIFSDTQAFDFWYQQMPAWRKRKIDAMKHESGKMLSLGVGVLLHSALNNMGLNEPQEAQTNEHERPYYAEYPELHFSLSHSGTKAFCAISNELIGCDVEKIKHRDTDIAKRFFTTQENNILDSIADVKERNEMFFRMWTLKESFLKAIGTGLDTSTDSFSILPESDRITIEQSITEADCNFVELDFNDGYRYALCHIK